MAKKQLSITLSEKACETIGVLVDETGLTASTAIELAMNYIEDQYLTAPVVVYYNNGYKIPDGRYNGGIRTD